MAIKKPNFKFIVLLLAYLAASIFIVAMIPYPLLVSKCAGMIPLSNFEGYKPFQYRVLMPLVIRGTEAITPNFIKEPIVRMAAPGIEARSIQRDQPAEAIGTALQYTYRTVLFIGLNILLMFFIMLAFRKLIKAFAFFPEMIADLLPLGLVLIIPIFYEYSVFIYDFSHLLLFTLGLYYLYKQNWPVYLIVLGLGILNKETMIMLAVIFFVYYLTILPRRLFIKLLIGQLAIFIVIKLALYLVFVNNPGVFMEEHFMRNIHHLANLSNYFRFETFPKGMLLPFMINIPWPRGLNVIMFGLLIYFIIYAWRSKPLFLRKSTAYFGITLILAVIWSYINELRSYYDFLPIIYILSTMGAYSFYRNIILKAKHTG